MSLRCPYRPTLLVLFLSLIITTTRGPLQAEAPVWEHLPNSTMVALRLRTSEALLERLTTETQFGKVLFSEARREALGKIVQEQLVEQSPDFQETLDEYELEIEDFSGIFAGDSGAALIAGTDDNPDQVCIAIWLSPSESLGDSLWSAFQQWLDEQDDETIEITEFDLAGEPVINFRRESPKYDMAQEELVDAFDNALLTKRGTQFLIMASYVAIETDDIDDHTAWLTDELAGLIEAPDGTVGGFANMAEETRPDGDLSEDEDTITELASNVQLCKEWAMQFDESEQTQTVLSMLGVNDVKAATLRITLGEQLVRQTAFLAWPTPRTGIGQILGRDQALVDPPAWVPASVASFSQANLDLGAAFATIKAEVESAFPESSQAFALAESQTKSFLQATVRELLESLGKQHYSIQLAPKMPDFDAPIEDWEEEDEVTQPASLVWQIEDVELWTKVMRFIGGVAPMSNLEPTDEQGFQGFRLVDAPVSGGVALGQGHVVVGVGGTVLESTLAAIVTPPTGSDAFRNSNLFENARQIAPLRPVTSIQISNPNQMLEAARSSLDGFSSQIEQYDEETQEELMPPLFKFAQQLLPSTKESEGLLGVAVTEFYVDDSGVVLHWINELPAPN